MAPGVALNLFWQTSFFTSYKTNPQGLNQNLNVSISKLSVITLHKVQRAKLGKEKGVSRFVNWDWRFGKLHWRMDDENPTS